MIVTERGYYIVLITKQTFQNAFKKDRQIVVNNDALLKANRQSACLPGAKISSAILSLPVYYTAMLAKMRLIFQSAPILSHSTIMLTE